MEKISLNKFIFLPSTGFMVNQEDLMANGDYCMRIQLGTVESAFASLIDANNVRIKGMYNKPHSGIRNWSQFGGKGMQFWLVSLDWTMAGGVRWFATARARTCSFYMPQFEGIF